MSTNNFFDRQETTGRQSLLLLGLFVVALLCMTLLVNLVAGCVSVLLGQSASVFELSPHTKWVTGLFWLTIFAGGGFRWLDVRAGGQQLARKFGAQPIEPTTTDRAEREALNIVDEMAVAASLAPPTAFVLPHERTINAFVVGHREDIALVLSREAIDTLERDHLKAIVAHEMAHLVNKDLPINMRLLITLGALNALDEVGQTLGADKNRTSNHPGVWVGFLLRALGSVCVFSGRLIRSAFSRRRELLADAKAIELTRNPDALADTLALIYQRRQTQLDSRYREELAHLCFQARVNARSARSFLQRLLSRLMSSHPAMRERITAIDPQFKARHRARQRQATPGKTRIGDPVASNSQTTAASTDSARTAPVADALSVATGTILAAQQLMTSSGEEAAYYSKLQQGLAAASGNKLSDEMVLSLGNGTSQLAMLFALFASDDVDASAIYYRELGFLYSKELVQTAMVFQAKFGACFAADARNILLQVAQVLGPQLDLPQRKHVLANIEDLVKQESEMGIVNYALAVQLRRLWGLDFPLLCDAALANGQTGASTKAPELADLHTEIALLLSLLVEASGNSEARVEDDYREILSCYTASAIPRRRSNEAGIAESMERAFQALCGQPRFVREVFLDHCAEVMLRDFHRTEQEQLLVELFAAALDCPPPSSHERLIAA